MNILQETCGNCGGTGEEIKYTVLHPGTAEITRETCGNCDGKGWREYAVFTVDEARAILNHCGLSTES